MATSTAPTFTERERQVAEGLRRYLTLGEIAAELGIAPTTAKHHADTLRLKLRVKYRREIPQAYAKAVGE